MVLIVVRGLSSGSTGPDVAVAGISAAGRRVHVRDDFR